MNREELYRRFGSQLVEAIVKLMLVEINILRANPAFALRTQQQVIDAVKAQLDDSPEYNWMNQDNK